MGKSPGKWIKTLLFGKKVTRSQSSKARSSSNPHLKKAGVDKACTVANGPPASSENCPVISEPVLVGTRGINRELVSGKASSVGDHGSGISPTSLGSKQHGTSGPGAETGPEKVREEEAAIKAQAAFRGFLARRAFHALKGIIRLQALVRGHLVRRQAVVTLRSMLGILKIQALARGQKAIKGVDSSKDELYPNAFICKYDHGAPNSVFSWMDRWTLSHFWRTPVRPKKTLDSKPQTRRGTYAMETESGRIKRNFKRSSLANVDSVGNINSDPEKTKHNTRKMSSASDTVPENPESELEKVKRNLRKVTGLMVETCDRSEIESDKQSRNMKKMSYMSSDALHQSYGDSAENTKKDIASIPEAKTDMEVSSKAAPTDSPVDEMTDDHPAVEKHPLQSINKDVNPSAINGESSLIEKQTSDEIQKTSKRRASFSAKPEYTENGAQNSPTLPSYMQATESAKAKLRGQKSPRFGTDSAEKDGVTRRHSLPSSTNGKLASHSPRTQRILQAAGKAGNRGDRSMSSSRDGNDRPIQVEWRR